MKWLPDAGNAFHYEFSFWFRWGGVRQFFCGTNFLWLGWEINAIFFWDEWPSISTYTREFLPGTNGFLSKDFFFFEHEDEASRWEISAI